MRFLLISLAAVVTCFGQSVQSAADVGTGVYTTSLVPGSQEILPYYSTPVTSASVSFLPAGTATPVAAHVVSVTGSSISFVVPANLPLGDAVLIYKLANAPSQWRPVTIVASNFSLFRSGTNGPLIALNLTPDNNGGYFDNGLSHPAQPGEAVMLWGAGLGLTPASAVQITLGGVAQTILYAGATPGIAGLNQINFQIAPGTPDGCYVPLVVNYGSQSFTSFLSKTSDGMPCHHPYGLSVNAMKVLDSGSSIPVETVSLSTAINAPAADRASRQENAEALQTSWKASDFANSVLQPTGVTGSQCVLANFSAGIVEALLVSPGTSGITLQNGATSLGLPWSTPQPVDANLASLPAATLTGGNWSLRVRHPAGRILRLRHSRSLCLRRSRSPVARPSRCSAVRIRPSAGTEPHSIAARP